MLNTEVEEKHKEMEKGMSEFTKENYKIKAIGYLDSSESFEKGEVSSSFLLKLDVLWNDGLVLGSLGHHECDFCEGGYGTNERAKSSSEKMLIDNVNKIKYIFPEMIFHYIKKHKFKPSNEFIEFVMRE